MKMLALAVLALLTPISASAQVTVWVDPVAGSDSASGLSEADPFQTITHAVSTAVAADEIRLAPGTYSVATGESFPMTVDSGTRIIGIGAREETIVQSAPDERVAYVRYGCHIEGVTFRGAQTTALFRSGRHTPIPTFTSCIFEDSRYALTGGSAAFHQCLFQNLSVGAYHLSLGSDNSHTRVNFDSCELTGCGAGGAVGTTGFYYDHFYIDIELSRCYVHHNAGPGILASLDPPSHANIRVLDCLITDNAAGISAGWHFTSADVEVIGSTIAGNQGAGIHSAGGETIVRSSIIAGNHGIEVAPHAQVEWSLISDGSGVLGAGAIVGDPRFVNPGAGDWSLRFDSPCLDRGEPGRFAFDLNGRTRAVDSDLDLVPAPDMGALEHLTLRGPESITVGDPLMLGVTGPDGGFSTVVMSPGGFASAGLNTPFGRYFLRPDTAFRLVPVPTTGGDPTWLDAGSMMDSAWAGTTIGVQALPRSLASPSGGAFTNPILVQLN